MLDRLRFQGGPLTDPYQIKNERLFLTFLVVSASILAVFVGVSFSAGQTIAATVNAVGAVALAALAVAYRSLGWFRAAVSAFTLIVTGIIAFQHIITPPALGSNTLWLCPLIIIALYMVGPRTGTGVAAASTLVVLGAEVLKSVRPLPLETFTRTDIFLFESTTIVLAGFTCWVVAHRIAREERQAFEALGEERQRLKASRDESTALVTLLSHDVANPLQVILDPTADLGVIAGQRLVLAEEEMHVPVAVLLREVGRDAHPRRTATDHGDALRRGDA